ncbi:MAG: hypothetical protein H6923_02460 [Alphaproteobacteria bacterium]|nr:hypothetical protein [Alphaproteobacteria bacterium]
MSLRVALSCAAAALALAGCGSDPKPGACPRAGILSDAANLVRFSGTGRGPEDVLYRGEITNVALDCSPHSDVVKGELTLTVRLALGPRATMRAETVRYFVAVTEGDARVLAKESFELPVSFTAGEAVATASDTVENVRIPLAPGRRGGAYEIVVGFELSPDEVAFNRAHQGS